MPARCARKTGDFTSHRDRVEAGVERIGNRAAQGADGPDARARRCVGVTDCHKAPGQRVTTLPQSYDMPPHADPMPGQVHGLSCKLLISLKKVLPKIQSI